MSEIATAAEKEWQELAERVFKACNEASKLRDYCDCGKEAGGEFCFNGCGDLHCIETLNEYAIVRGFNNYLEYKDFVKESEKEYELSKIRADRIVDKRTSYQKSLKKEPVLNRVLEKAKEEAKEDFQGFLNFG